jgi:hypothetical protein
MSDSRFIEHEECNTVLTELRGELRRLIDLKWDGRRKDFKIKKKVVIKLLQTLIQDVKTIRYR